MTCGALIFAFNNEATDYVSMAAWSAGRIRHHLGIPVAVVTNSRDPALNKMFDQVIYAEPESGGTRFFEDYNSTVTWHNAGRVDAYALTPWEQTLVLDADYVVASTQLKFVIDSRRDFMCHDRAYDIAKSRYLDELNTFGEHRLPMSWATVMYFNKCKLSESIFEMMIMNSEIRELAFQRAGVSKLRAAAVRGGMRSLLGDGRIKILKGVTTPDEVAKYAQIEGFDPSEVTKR